MADPLVFDIIGRDKASPAFARVGKSIENTERSVGALQRGFGQLGTAAVGAAAGFGAMEVWQRTVGAASDLNETISKTRTVFGQSSTELERWADTAATSVGMSKRAALEGASAFGNLFQQIGLTGDQAQGMSQNLVKLTADFASFHNADPAQVMEAMLAATRGEYDALQRFVPTASAAAVEAQALADSGKASARELTAADKATGLYNLILKDAGAAQGDFSRTADSAANQQRVFKARIEDTGAAIGNTLLPAYQGFLGVINNVGPLYALGAAAALVFGKQIGSNVALAKTAVGVYALELRDSVKASSAASGSTSRFATALGATRVAAGGAGKALGGMVGFLGGPWGIALAGAALAVGYLTSQQAEQKQRAESLRGALVQLAGTYDDLKNGNTESAEAVVSGDEQLQNFILTANRLGVEVDEVVRALGGEKKALDEVNKAYDEELAKLQKRIDAADNPIHIKEFFELSRKKKALEAERDALNEATKSKEKSNKASGLLAAATKDEAEAAQVSTEAQIRLAEAMATLASKTSTAEEKTQALKVAQDELYGAQINQSEATEAYAASVDSMTASLEKNGATLDVNTEKGRQNRDSIESRLEASKRMYEADIAAGVSVEEATRRHHRRTAALRDEAHRAGLNRKQVNALIDTYGRVPTDLETVIRTKGAAVTAETLARLRAWQIALATNKPIEAVLPRVRGERAKLLKRVERGGGGPVDGPGTSTSDDVPAWLSKGEYVHNAAAVDYYGTDVMKALNQRKIPRNSLLVNARRYRYGGLVQFPFPVDVSKTTIPTQAQVAAAVFDQGGWLMPGLTLALNTTGRPERVDGPLGDPDRLAAALARALTRSDPDRRIGDRAVTVNLHGAHLSSQEQAAAVGQEIAWLMRAG